MRKFLRTAAWLGLTFAAVAVLTAGALAWVAVRGVDLDLAGQHERLAGELSKRFGLPVRIDGAVRLRASLAPELAIDSIAVGHAGDGQYPLTLKHARLALDARPLLRGGQVHLRDLEASDASARIERTAAGRLIWLPLPEAGSRENGADRPGKTRDAQPPALLALGIDRLALARITVTLHEAGKTLHNLDLESLVLRAPLGEPTVVAANGRLDQRYEYALQIEAGSL
jgi:hypothetical protein